MRHVRIGIPLLLVPFLIAVIPGVASATHRMWLPREQGTTISYEFTKAKLRHGSILTFWSSASFISGRIQASDNWGIAFDIPFAHLGYTEDFPFTEGHTGTALGNPYIGAEHDSHAGHILEFGIRFPVASEDDAAPLALGIITDRERAEALATDLVTAQFAYNYRRVYETGGLVWVRGSPVIWIPTDSGDPELLADWGFMGGYSDARFEIIGGITGRILVSEDGSFAERSIHHLGVTGSVVTGRVRPGASLRLPLDDDIGESIDFFWSLNVTVHFR